MRGYADAGVDQVILVSQSGRNRHDHICESLELFAREVMPELREGEEARDKAEAGEFIDAIELGTGWIVSSSIENIKET